MFGCLLSGCAGIAPSNLIPIQNGCTIKLSDDLVFEANRGIFGTRYEFRTVQGDYRAIFTDQGGTYYQGAPSCHREKVVVAGGLKGELVGKVVLVSDCGLYVPKDSSNKVSMYIVTGTGASMLLGDTEEQVQRAIAVTTQSGTNAIAIGDSKDRGAQSDNIAISPAVNSASLPPLQAGVAGGVAAGVVGALVQAERGRYFTFPEQVEATAVRHSIGLLCR